MQKEIFLCICNDWKNEVENALKVFHYEVFRAKRKRFRHKKAVDKAESECEKYKGIQDKIIF